MLLDSRKLRILQAIIEDYILNGEPVGSTAIAKKYDLNLSSATIRNEMAMLEELGLINQPHISAGRIPTDKGYRIYVDSLMPSYNLSTKEMTNIKNMLKTTTIDINQLMTNITELIAKLTNYTSVAIGPRTENHIVKHIYLVPIESNKILLVVVTNAGKAREVIFRINKCITPDILFMISNFLNIKLYNNSFIDILSDMNLELDDNIMYQKEVIDLVFDTLKYEINSFEKTEVFQSGATNIFNFREFTDINKAKDFFDILKDENVLRQIFSAEYGKNIKVLIGSENENEKINVCSIVRADYEFGDNVIGKIGIIGPTRMNYSKVVAYIEYITKELEKLLEK